MSAPLEVVFTFREGDVWIDPDGVGWYVKHTGVDGNIAFERTLVEHVDPKVAARTWRRVGDE